MLNMDIILKMLDSDAKMLRKDHNDVWKRFKKIIFQINEDIMIIRKFLSHDMMIKNSPVLYKHFITMIPVRVREFSYYKMCIDSSEHSDQVFILEWLKSNGIPSTDEDRCILSTYLSTFKSVWFECIRLYLILVMIGTLLKYTGDPSLGSTSIIHMHDRIKEEVCLNKENFTISKLMIKSVLSNFPVNFDSFTNKYWSFINE